MTAAVQMQRRGGSLPWKTRVRIAAPWAFVFLLGVILMAGHRFLLPRGRGWLDTYAYARAASSFVAHPGALYDAAQAQLHSAIPVNAFIYPPSALIPFLPLVPVTRTLGLAWTAEIWSCVDMVALVAALALMARQLGIGVERSAWVVAGLLLSLPVLAEVSSGQVEGVVLLLLVLSWRSWPRTSSGVLLGAALAVKPVAPWLLLLPLAMRRPRVTVAALATMAALNLPFLPVVGAAGIGFYVLRFLPFMATHVMDDPANGSVAQVLHMWIGDPLSRLRGSAIVETVLLLFRGSALALVARELVLRRRSPLVVFAMALAAVPLLAPTAWAHYYVFVLPAVMVLLTARSARVRMVTGACVLGCAVLNSLLDATTFHLAMYPMTLARSHSLANLLTLAQYALMALASVWVVLALGVARLQGDAWWARHLPDGAAAAA